MGHKRINKWSLSRDARTGKYLIKEGRLVRGGVTSTGTLQSRPEPPAPSKVPAPKAPPNRRK